MKNEELVSFRRASSHYFKCFWRWWTKFRSTRNFCEAVSLVHLEVRGWSGAGGPMLWTKPKQVSTHYFKGFWRWWTKFHKARNFLWDNKLNTSKGQRVVWTGGPMSRQTLTQVSTHHCKGHWRWSTKFWKASNFYEVISLSHLEIRGGLALNILHWRKHESKFLPTILKISVDDGSSFERLGIFCKVIHLEVRGAVRTRAPMLQHIPKQLSTHHFEGHRRW